MLPFALQHIDDHMLPYYIADSVVIYHVSLTQRMANSLSSALRNKSSLLNAFKRKSRTPQSDTDEHPYLPQRRCAVS